MIIKIRHLSLRLLNPGRFRWKRKKEIFLGFDLLILFSHFCKCLSFGLELTLEEGRKGNGGGGGREEESGKLLLRQY